MRTTFFIIIPFSTFCKPVNSFASISSLGNNGQLGNQLFQYPVAREYSIKYSIPLLLADPDEHLLDNFQISESYLKQ